MNLESFKKLEIKYKRVIAEELLRRADNDECLMNKLLSTDKTIEDCFKYIKSEAKKQAEENCACLCDEEVFKMAQHFFMEDSIVVKSNKKQDNEEDNTKNENEELVENNEISTTNENKPKKKQSKESKKEELKKKMYDGLDLFSI